MNENAKKWVAALRSGDYDQGINCLQFEDHYCCLGVACKVYETETGVTLKSEKRWPGSKKEKLIGEDLTPYRDVKEWLGLNTVSGTFDSRVQGANSLIDLNDGTGLTFSQIADVIESEPKGLFKDEERS